MQMIPTGEPHPNEPQALATDRIALGFQVFEFGNMPVIWYESEARMVHAQHASTLRTERQYAAAGLMVQALIAAEGALQVRLPRSGALKQVTEAIEAAIGIREKPDHIKRAEAKHAEG